VQGSDPDVLLSRYNRENEALGRFWTGNLHTGRMYGLLGMTTFSTPSDVIDREVAADEMARSVKSNFDFYSEMSRRRYKEGDGKEASRYYYRAKPYAGIIFKADVATSEIRGFNPESFPLEYEARTKYRPQDVEKNWSLPEKYNDAIEIGFIEHDGRTVSWHKIRRGDDERTLRELHAREPDSVQKIPPLKFRLKGRKVSKETKAAYLRGEKGHLDDVQMSFSGDTMGGARVTTTVPSIRSFDGREYRFVSVGPKATLESVASKVPGTGGRPATRIVRLQDGRDALYIRNLKEFERIGI